MQYLFGNLAKYAWLGILDTNALVVETVWDPRSGGRLSNMKFARELYRILQAKRFQNHAIYRSAALPASKTSVFTAPARKRLQQHMQKHGKYRYDCSRSLNPMHKHAKTRVLLLRQPSRL
jgi:hypothetical protein